MLQVQSPFQQFFDSTGTPLDNGSIYIGTTNLNPEVSPITCYWDYAGTQPVAQPIKTSGGYAVRNGTVSQIFTSAADYSLTVRDSKGNLIYYAPSVTSISFNALAASSGSTLIGFLGTLANDQATTVSAMLDKFVVVTRFGAVGNGMADDSDAIQHAMDSGAGMIFFPKGNYKVTKPLNVPDYVALIGVGGSSGSLITGTHAGNILQHGYLSFFSMYGMAFTGAGCTALKQTSFILNYYCENLTVENCHFYGQLTECIYADLIFCKIVNNTFGYFGTVGAAHRHIASLGTGGVSPNLANLNQISRNRFYNAVGNESVRADDGVNYEFTGNNWEGNEALPLRLNGIIGAVVRQCWFENNSITTAEIEINQGAGPVVIDSTPTTIEHCTFYPNASVTNFVQINNNNTRLYFDRNAGIAMGRTLTNDATKVYSTVGNNLTGYTAGDVFRTNGVQFAATQIASSDPNTLDDYEEGTWVPIDSSGAGLSLTASAKYTKVGNIIFVVGAVTYPVTANATAAKIGGLPVASAAITPLTSIDNSTLSLTLTTDAGTTLTFYTDGTFAVPTNANLSGKQIYFSGTYRI
jgi:hypothetical protein